MYVCPKIYIRRALNKVTDAPQSQTNKNVINARLKRLIDRSTKRKKVGKLNYYLTNYPIITTLSDHIYCPHYKCE